MSSSRLPGKVLMDVCGKPALTRLLERLRAVPNVDDVVLATTDKAADDPLAAWAAKAGVLCYRGSEDDVLDRVVQAQRHAGGEVVVEVTGDCTLLCPDVIELGVETFFANACDVVSNCGAVQTWPQGADVQVFPFERLREVAETVNDTAVREHVSLYFYEQPKRYRIHYMVAPPAWREPGWRWQLDYPEDLAFIRQVYAALEPRLGPVFGIADIVSFLRANPQVVAVNAHCVEKAAR
jgi:spore coat polysaccharide biosynthesis protein SpsF